MPEEEDKEMLAEPPISQSAEWVQWKAEKCDVPNLVGRIIYCSAGRHRKTSPRGESFIPTPKAYA